MIFGKDYETVCQRITEELEKRKTDKSTFSLQGRRIDDLISEKELKTYDSRSVFFAAVNAGLEYDVCRYGEETGAHTFPAVRANGVWIRPAETYHFVDDLTNKYPQGRSQICSSCELRYRDIVLAQARYAHELMHEQRA